MPDISQAEDEYFSIDQSHLSIFIVEAAYLFLNRLVELWNINSKVSNFNRFSFE